MTEQEQTAVWYVRRSTTVQGPYPATDIRRYLLLGRLRLSDRVSLDASSWQPLTQCAELIPDEMRDLGSAAGRARFEVARRAVDERTADRDRSNGGVAAAKRTGVRAWRPARGQVLAGIGLAAVIAGLIAIGHYRDFDTGPAAQADCSAVAPDGTNASSDPPVWNGCVKDGLQLAAHVRLDGLQAINVSLRHARLAGVDLGNARLDYADLTAADLARADLHGTVLHGASLRHADLTAADLHGADLRNADLRSARLKGADLRDALLGNALWIDGRACGADSVGECR